MIVGSHGLITAADITKGYMNHEFVIGLLSDSFIRSTSLQVNLPCCSILSFEHIAYKAKRTKRNFNKQFANQSDENSKASVNGKW